MSILDENILEKTNISMIGFPKFEEVERYSNSMFGYSYRNDRVIKPEVYPDDKHIQEEIINGNITWYAGHWTQNEPMSRTVIVSCTRYTYNNINLDHDKYTIELSIGYLDKLDNGEFRTSGFYDVKKLLFKDEQINEKLARKKAYELLELIRDYPNILYILEGINYVFNLKELKKFIKTHKNELA